MYLAAHLESVLGWEAGPQDVMSGYGAGGDVANGSFEERAPFGGFGWRYRDAPGVERVHDPDGAFDGEHYLRLTKDAAIHQPNPARPGQTVTATLRLRGGAEGDVAQITLDFRDQEMWTDPLSGLASGEALTTEWAEYTITAAAPDAGARPVFHTRLTLQAGFESTVEVDLVEMTTE